VCKIWTKNSKPFGKNVRKPQGVIFLTHTVQSSTWTSSYAEFVI